MAPFVTLFIQPSLLSLVFVPMDGEHIRPLLAQVKDQAASLQLLALPEADPDALESLGEELSSTICSLSHLTTLDFNYIPVLQNAFAHLSRLPSLSAFSVSLTKDNDGSWTSAGWGGFPALERLDVSSLDSIDNFACLPSFLGSIEVTKLTDLTVLADIPLDMDANVGQLFSVLGRFRSLEDCSIIFYDEEADWGAQCLDTNALSPLHNLSRMTNFCVKHIPIRLASDDISKLTKAFPHLRSFSLVPNLGTPYSRLQLEDLALFAKHCPNIEYLNIELESPQAGWVYDPGDDDPVSNLPRLCLGRSHITRSAAEPAAEFLAHIFPFAKLFHHLPGYRHTPEDEEAAQVLNKIWELKKNLNFPLIQQLRRQRRAEKKKRFRQARRAAAV